MAGTPPQMALLLGAGASAPAGVPTTLEFVEDFQKSLRRRPALRQAYQKLLSDLRRAARDSHSAQLVDVEAVLDSLETIRSPTIVDLATSKPGYFRPGPNSAKLDSIRAALQEFMRKKCLVTADRTDYLLPLIQLANAFRPLPIFTLNYDVVIEQFLESHGLSYADGFELRFNPELLGKTDVDAHLFKLHGSVTWFKSQTGGYLKLPIRSNLRRIDLLSGERAEPVMLYPAQKADYAGPFLELFRRLQETLRHAEWLLVIGYSFRDPILLDVVLDAAIANPKLKVVLICGGRTEQIFARGIASRIGDVQDYRSQRGAVVKDRFIRLPFRIRESFSDFVSVTLPGLQKATLAHTSSIWAELHGEPARWREAVEEYFRAGAFTQGNEIYQKGGVSFNPLQQDEEFKFNALRALAGFANGRPEAEVWWSQTVFILNQWVVDRVKAFLELSPQQRVRFGANWHVFSTGHEGGFDYPGVASRLQDVGRTASVLARCVGKGSAREKLQPRAKALGRLVSYLSTIPVNGFDLAVYFVQRRRFVTSRMRTLAESIRASYLNDTTPVLGEVEELGTLLAIAEGRYIRRTFFKGVLAPPAAAAVSS